MKRKIQGMKIHLPSVINDEQLVIFSPASTTVELGDQSPSHQFVICKEYHSLIPIFLTTLSTIWPTASLILPLTPSVNSLNFSSASPPKPCAFFFFSPPVLFSSETLPKISCPNLEVSSYQNSNNVNSSGHAQKKRTVILNRDCACKDEVYLTRRTAYSSIKPCS